ncbi:hypothetical protein CMI46_00750, partial [Candidatus Pacearchaeota archaeon]|nr:hypothetical protein [Candidatus Pacearchaeota archaeon]
AESGATLRTSIGVGATNDVRFNNLTLAGNLSVGAADFFVNPGLGRVGIGTASPNNKLEIYASSHSGINITSGDASYNTALMNYRQYADGQPFTELISKGKPIIGAYKPVGGTFSTALMGGNVGIGTASPDRTLEVIGDAIIGEEGEGLVINTDGHLSDEDDAVTINDNLTITGDISINDDITSIDDIIITGGDKIRGSYLIIGADDTGRTKATGEGDLFVRDVIEVEGTAWLTGGTTWTQGDIAETMATKSSRENKLCNGDIGCLKESTGDDLDYGDLICIDTTGAKLITKCTEANSQLVVGFISNTAVLNVDPGMVNGYPVALAGIVNAKVSNVNGDIYPGDLIVSAEKDGYAMKSTNPKIGTVVGKAFDFCDKEECKIPVFIALS